MSKRTPALLDPFIPCPDVRGRHEIVVRAPAELVLNEARNFEIESIWLVRTLFHLRAALMGAKSAAEQPRAGLVEQMLKLGWGCLADDRNRHFVAGAVCTPWQAEPGFTPVAPGQFASYAEPDRVKIAWTLEAAELAPAVTRFGTETRVIATDDEARRKFRSLKTWSGAHVKHPVRLHLGHAPRR